MPVQYDMRQPTTKEMCTVAINHIVINLESRVESYLLWKVANIPSSAYKKTKQIRVLARRLKKQVFKGEEVVNEEDGREELQAVLDEVNGYLRPVLVKDNGKVLGKSGRRGVAHLFL
eukprot:47803-Eustigmatos_ZCMA.PRE.1